jgi:uncharacterized Zn finger protein
MQIYTNWIAEDVYDFITQNFHASILEDVKELIHERRVHEVYLEPGRISSRIITDSKRSKRVVLSLKEFDSAIWDDVLDMVAERPLLCAQCYNHFLPFAIKPFFGVHNVSLIGSTADFICTVDDQIQDYISVEAAAVMEKLAEQLLSNPFGICTVRGRNAEQVIHELREKRASKGLMEGTSVRAEEIPSAVQFTDPSRYYLGRMNDVPEITVRADELPASILKRLDPVPIETPEIQADPLLESAYGRVARLSQSLARFLPQF